MKKILSLVLALGALWPIQSQAQVQFDPTQLGYQLTRVKNGGEAAGLIGINANQVALTNINSLSSLSADDTNEVVIYRSNGSVAVKTTVSNFLSLARSQMLWHGPGGTNDGVYLVNVNAATLGGRRLNSRAFGIEASDYGAVGFVTNTLQTVWNVSLPDLTTNLQNAINAAAAATGYSNTVFIGPGVFRITTNLIVPAKVNIVGCGFVHNTGSGTDSVTNGYTLLWLNNTNSYGVVAAATEFGPMHLLNFEVCGFTNPLCSSITLRDFAGAMPGKLGVRIKGSSQVYCGHVQSQDMVVTGFKVGVANDGNDCMFIRLQTGGNDIGYMSANATNRTELNDVGLGYLNTNGLNLFDTSPPPADQCTFVNPSYGQRTNGLGWLLSDVKGMTIIGSADISYSRYMVAIGSDVNIVGGNSEPDGFVSTNLIKLIGNCGLNADCLNLKVTGVPDSVRTNFCFVDSVGGNWIGRWTARTLPPGLTYKNTGAYYFWRMDYNSSVSPKFIGCVPGIVGWDDNHLTWISEKASAASSSPARQIRGNIDWATNGMAGSYGDLNVQLSNGHEPYFSSVLSGTHDQPVFGSLYFTRFLTADRVTDVDVRANPNIEVPQVYGAEAFYFRGGTNIYGYASLPNNTLIVDSGRLLVKSNGVWVVK